MIYSTITMAAAILSTLTLQLVNAEVIPSEPGPGSVFREGQTCRVGWVKDPVADAVWKNMNIQLMTGDNFAMVHLTTVATGQDGTVDGFFQYPCPDVTPQAPIYFYQFTSPASDIKTWTTRFAIASSAGEVVPAENEFQPTTNDAIPWGVGALANPSLAVAPPQIGCSTCQTSVATGAAIAIATTSTIATSAPPANPSITVSTNTNDNINVTPAVQITTTSNTPPRMVVTVSSTLAAPSGGVNSSIANPNNGALGNVVGNNLLYTALLPLAAWLFSL